MKKLKKPDEIWWCRFLGTVAVTEVDRCPAHELNRFIKGTRGICLQQNEKPCDAVKGVIKWEEDN